MPLCGDVAQVTADNDGELSLQVELLLAWRDGHWRPFDGQCGGPAGEQIRLLGTSKSASWAWAA